ncbi:MAG: UDP-N-acetylmuramate--alanine ligase [Thermoleophilaceae bacterium]|jgi:UDP-N-acetylmuramate--alanine ligase|nr:UDP-N-acetylmuramate--alanine ligase [Thermoleophilaceae bacterium]
MSGLALVAAQLGAEVSGSDRAESSYSERLRAAGIEPAIGHDAANVPDGADVVVSTAIPDSNPELERARELGLRVLHRGDLLAEASALKKSIAVAGAHGKTTTTGMLAHVLRATGRDPAFLIGGELREAGTNAAWGTGEWIVVEADESDRSFLKLDPDVAVITNIELDHHTTYSSEADLVAAFDEFSGKADLVIGPIEPGSGDDVELVPGGSRFRVRDVAVELQVPGAHNVLNALAALAAAEAAGVPLAEAAPAIAGFTGTGRRFEARGQTAAGARIFDDYAHHPTEVRATLEAARTLGAKRVVAAFQPHLYSRTQHLARQFGDALALADAALVVDIYPARERQDDFPGVTGYLVAAAAANAANGRPVWWIPSLDQAGALLESELEEGDVLLTLGAGNIDSLAERLAAS